MHNWVKKQQKTNSKSSKDGRVAKFDFKGIASQATLGAKLPGRLQDISEQVLVIQEIKKPSIS